MDGDQKGKEDRFFPLNPKRLGGESRDIYLKEPKVCNHIFSYYKAGEIICDKCRVGFFIEGSEHLKNGHLYKGNKKVI